MFASNDKSPAPHRASRMWALGPCLKKIQATLSQKKYKQICEILKIKKENTTWCRCGKLSGLLVQIVSREFGFVIVWFIVFQDGLFLSSPGYPGI